MPLNSNLKELILKGVKKAQTETIEHLNIYNNDYSVDKENEFLFFLKPELTLASPAIKFDAILDLIFGKIEEVGLTIKNVNVIGAKYLDEYNIIAQHYGVINKLAANAKDSLSDAAREQFYQVYQKTVDEVDVLGGIEFLSKYPSFTPHSLEQLWEQSDPQVKLAGGTYCRILPVEGTARYVINGFHPSQLIHFTASGRSIVTVTLCGDLSWADARNSFIGATNPEKAQQGSLRKLFLENKFEIGLSEVSQGQNGVHLSAGPVEGLVELVRYNSDFSDKNEVKPYSEFAFGRKLANNFDETTIEKILSNANVTTDARMISIFDLTEELDSDQAINLLRQHL